MTSMTEEIPTLCDDVFAGIVLLDENLRIVYANHEIARKGDVKIDDVVGQNFLNFFEDPESVRRFIQNPTPESHLLAYLITPKGKKMYVKIKAKKYGTNTLVTLLDLSELGAIKEALVKSEEMFRGMAESSMDAIVIADHDGKIRFWNSAAERIFGFTKDEALGKKVDELIIPESMRKKYRRALSKFKVNKITEGRIYELEGRRKDGTSIPVEISLGPVSFGDGVGVVAVIRDISERKRKEKNLEAERRELELLYTILDKITRHTEPAEIYEVIYRELKYAIPQMDAFLIAIKHSENRLDVDFVIGEGKRYPPHSLPLDEKLTLTGWVFKNEKTLHIQDVESDKLPAGINLVGVPMRSWVGIPLKYMEKTIGVLSVQSKEPNAFSDTQIKFLERVAHSIAAVIHTADMYEHLKASEERYRILLENSVVGIATTDLNNKFTYVNRFFANMLGYEPHEIIGKHLRDFATEEGYKKLAEGTVRRKRGITDSYEAEFRHRDGRAIPVLVYASPLRNMKNEIIGTIGIAMDISERKQMEEQLNRERRKYRTLFENVGVGVAVIQDKRVVYVNEELTDMLGMGREQIIGESIDKFVHPDDLPLAFKNYERRLRGLDAPRTYIMRLIDSKNDVLWVKLKATITEWEGKTAILASLTDVTTIKRTQDMLVSLDEVFRKLGRSKDEKSMFRLVVNHLKYTLNFGDVKIYKIEKTHLLNVLKPSERHDLRDNIVASWVARNGTSYYAPNMNKERNMMPIMNFSCEYATPILVGGEIFGVIAVRRAKPYSISSGERMVVDMVSKHLSVHIENLRHMRDLEQSKNMYELMMHIVSHDVKNPLAIIKGYVELMREEQNPEFLDEIDKAVEEASRIITQARLFSKLDLGKVKQEKKFIKIAEMILSSYELVNKKYHDAKIEIRGDAEIEVYPILREAFVNILDNAYKYGASKVEVSVESTEDCTIIKFSDNGVGIEDSKKQRIFEVFEKGDRGGSGLGLAIVKRVVELHNGKIYVKDNVPRGSIFVLEIPECDDKKE